jgi:hypothetical protein
MPKVVCHPDHNYAVQRIFALQLLLQGALTAGLQFTRWLIQKILARSDRQISIAVSAVKFVISCAHILQFGGATGGGSSRPKLRTNHCAKREPLGGTDPTMGGRIDPLVPPMGDVVSTVACLFCGDGS